MEKSKEWIIAWAIDFRHAILTLEISQIFALFLFRGNQNYTQKFAKLRQISEV